MTTPAVGHLSDLPDLPEPTPPEALKGLDEAALDGVAAGLTDAERRVVAAMAPFDRLLREVRMRQSELATERRRRERAARHAARIAVRAAAGSESLPALADALAAPTLAIPDDRALREVRAFLATGGEVGFGFATRPGTITFTDGRKAAPATTVGAARALFAEGWEPGTPGIPGVRVHLIGTRIERVMPADQVLVQVPVEVETQDQPE